MKINRASEKRVAMRHRVVADVSVNGGTPHQGGKLYDISTDGALIKYPEKINATTKPIEVNEKINLNMNGSEYLNGFVVRTMKDGFAVQFERLGFGSRLPLALRFAFGY